MLPTVQSTLLVNDDFTDLSNVPAECTDFKPVFSLYLDDVLILIAAMFVRLLENPLYVKAEKCEFHITETSFGDFLLSTMPEWPPSTSR